MAAFQSPDKETSKDLAAMRCSLSKNHDRFCQTDDRRCASLFFFLRMNHSRDRLASKSARPTSGSAEFHALAPVGHQREMSAAAVNRLMNCKKSFGSNFSLDGSRPQILFENSKKKKDHGEQTEDRERKEEAAAR